jgi:hypothetical protein
MEILKYKNNQIFVCFSLNATASLSAGSAFEVLMLSSDT